VITLLAREEAVSEGCEGVQDLRCRRACTKVTRETRDEKVKARAQQQRDRTYIGEGRRVTKNLSLEGEDEFMVEVDRGGG